MLSPWEKALLMLAKQIFIYFLNIFNTRFNDMLFFCRMTKLIRQLLAMKHKNTFIKTLHLSQSSWTWKQEFANRILVFDHFNLICASLLFFLVSNVRSYKTVVIGHDIERYRAHVWRHDLIICLFQIFL